MRFELGTFYSFTIVNEIEIPEKGHHYVLLHESSRKMLLKSEYYVKYNFSVGQSIECRIDKVNCAGQIFLEPKHPFYKENALYSFKVLAILKNLDKSSSLLVEDKLGNKIEVFLPKSIKIECNEIMLRVEKIKKGQLKLSFPTENNAFKPPEKLISAKVFTIIVENGEEYYSITDQDHQVISRLKVRHYKHYGLDVGKTFTAKILAEDPNGLKVLEPINPWYTIGESYFFKIFGTESIINLEGEQVYSLILLDKGSNKTGIEVSIKIMKQIGQQKEIKCRVIGFRKGRPQLEIDL